MPPPSPPAPQAAAPPTPGGPMAPGAGGAPPPKQGTGANEIVMQAAQQVKAGAISPQQFIALLTKLQVPPEIQQQICQKLGIPWQAPAGAAPGGAPQAAGGGGPAAQGDAGPPSPGWEK